MKNLAAELNDYELNVPRAMQSIRVSDGYDKFYQQDNDWHFLTIVTNEKGHADELRNAGLMIVYKDKEWLGVYGLKINPVHNNVEQVLAHNDPLDFMLRIEFRERDSFEFRFEEEEHLDKEIYFEKVSVFIEDKFVKDYFSLISDLMPLDKKSEDFLLEFNQLLKEVDEKLDYDPFSYEKVIKELEADGFVPTDEELEAIRKEKQEQKLFNQWLEILKGNPEWYKAEA